MVPYPGMKRALSAGIIGGIAILMLAQMMGVSLSTLQGPTPTIDVRIGHVEGTVSVDRNGDHRAAKEGDHLRRGEIVRSGEDGYATLVIGPGALIGLDVRTDLTLDALNDRPTFHITRGRIAARAHQDVRRLTFVTNETSTTLLNRGSLTIVQYDFLNQVVIAPLHDTPLSVIAGDEFTTITTTPLQVIEYPIVLATDTTFTPNTSTSAAFYERFAEEEVGSKK